jgi:transglycosylase-like protein with SLT domain
MSSPEVRKRTRGRWKAALLLWATLVMTVQGTVPVQAKQAPGPRLHGPFDQPALPEQPKLTKKKHKNGKRKPGSIKGMIEREFGKHADEAMRIAFCESRFDPNDVSGAGAVGIFQIRTVDHGWRVKKVHGKDLTDPWTNVRVAHHIYEHQGWGPWVCARILGISGGRSHRTHRVRNVRRSETRHWNSANSARRGPREPRSPSMSP